MSTQGHVAIVGGGLVGCLAAIAFQKRNYKVTLIEYRQDPRDEEEGNQNLRSINLAISDRGFRALRYIDEPLLDKILDEVIPMHGRMIHDLEGNEESQLYGLYGESINSIDRSYLNRILLDEIDEITLKEPENKIEILFGHKLVDLKFQSHSQSEKAIIKVVDLTSSPTTLEFDFVIGADGAFSATRYHMQKKLRMNFEQEYIDTCYIELYIPPGPGGSFKIDPNHLHIWPRHKFMLIALANKDGSFTSTFFAPWGLLESLNTKEVVLEFFQTHFKDALEIMGEEKLVESFLNNPKGSLVQIHCNPYNYKGKLILIGDAAHAMVPFYGQGMNCGFESLRVLLETIDQQGEGSKDLEKAFSSYSVKRHDDLEAILKLLLDNYHEMSHKVTSPLYLLRKKVDGILSRLLKDRWLPLYTMVSFRGDISYSRLINTEKRQQLILKKVQHAVFLTLILGSVKLYSVFQRYLKSH